MSGEQDITIIFLKYSEDSEIISLYLDIGICKFTCGRDFELALKRVSDNFKVYLL